jgi:hypothetical protein
MPNYCENTLTVTNLTNEQAKEITKAISEGNLLEHFVPCPEDKTCVEYWGTKWDILNYNESSQCSDTATSVEETFDTAWSPPLLGLQRISKLFPEAEFSIDYIEDGCDFIGVSLIKDGVLRDNCADLSPALNKAIALEHPEFFDEDGEVLDDEEDAYDEFKEDVMYDIVDPLYEQLRKELPEQGVTLEESSAQEELLYNTFLEQAQKRLSE